MKRRSIILLLSVLSVFPAYSQNVGSLGIVVGQIRTAEASANAVFGYFENGEATGAGGVSTFADGGNASGIENATASDKAIGFRIAGRTVSIDATQAANGVSIHTLDGRTSYTGKATTITLPAGLYLISVNGSTHKIIIN